MSIGGGESNKVEIIFTANMADVEGKITRLKKSVEISFANVGKKLELSADIAAKRLETSAIRTKRIFDALQTQSRVKPPAKQRQPGSSAITSMPTTREALCAASCASTR